MSNLHTERKSIASSTLIVAFLSENALNKLRFCTVYEGGPQISLIGLHKVLFRIIFENFLQT